MTHTDNPTKKNTNIKNKNIMTASLPCSFKMTPRPFCRQSPNTSY